MALTDFQQVRHLNECTAESFLGALMECSQLGLEPGRVLGQAYLLPFKNKTGQYICRMIPGYQGLCAIARRSGEIKKIWSRAVYENDYFDYDYGLDEFLKHKPTKDEGGELIYVYAAAVLMNGEKQFEVMNLKDIEKSRSRSKSADDGPWVTDFIAMAKKSCLKKLCRSLPSSIQLRAALSMDSREEDHQDFPLEEDNFGVLPSPQEIRLIKPVKENSDVSFDRSRSRSPEGIDSQADDYSSGVVLPEGNPRGSESDIRTEEKKSNQHIETTKKDPKQKEIGLLRMQIQNLLFAKTGEPEHIEAILKDVSLKSKCSMGHMFLTVQDLATCENVAWMKEITDSLGQMK
jgi:phage RecT family recombinase